jgi:hypothetical protein
MKIVYLLGGSHDGMWLACDGHSDTLSLSLRFPDPEALANEQYRRFDVDAPYAVFAAEKENWTKWRCRVEVARRSPSPPDFDFSPPA